MTETDGAGSAAVLPTAHQTASSMGTMTAAEDTPSNAAAGRSAAVGMTVRAVCQESRHRPTVSMLAPRTCSGGASLKPTATTGGPRSTRATMMVTCRGRPAAQRRAATVASRPAVNPA
jgi:hypothetical protein